ncbi:PrgI family mobile element protein [Dictyobacter aurantiacus]|uniref:Uncharacterized protein n=1 Tax=Dictyobacter aurantiacus TaxID=1936993 RepID=A0A401ZRM0_9CHLR|nr:PrgI family protein [Dictyobacter aurantiacus]GCE09515.1 hypothetical protein KDAU_68440 [Dictyobacter aurantiacus]
MSNYKHKIPIHLEVSDHIILGLTTRQLLLIGSGVALDYTLWSSLSFLNGSDAGLVCNALCSLVPVVIGVAAAFLRPAARGLEQWAMVWLLYLLTPKTYLWQQLPDEDLAPVEQLNTPVLDYDEEEE